MTKIYFWWTNLHMVFCKELNPLLMWLATSTKPCRPDAKMLIILAMLLLSRQRGGVEGLTKEHCAKHKFKWKKASRL